MNTPYNIQNTNICNGIFHISFFKALLINEGKTTRGEREQGNNDSRGETTPTAFRLVLSAGKLNLPLVPSQDYVLQDNKRCYDKILSDWNFRPPSLGFKCILVGLMNMIDGMQFWTPIIFYRHKTVLLSPWLQFMFLVKKKEGMGNQRHHRVLTPVHKYL